MTAPTLLEVLQWATDRQIVEAHERVEAAGGSGLVLEPGVYAEMPDRVYHADPVPGRSLSSTGARALLGPKGTPARFRHDLDNPRPARAAFDIGHAAHMLALGIGPELVVVKADNWRTKVAQDAKAAAHARGAVPLLPAAMAEVQAMADELRKHPDAAALLDPRQGDPERSMFWRDPITGVWLRARVDFIRRTSRRIIGVDYKSTTAADDESIGKALAEYRYYQQAAWYIDAMIALGLGGPETGFVFIFQEKSAPYLVNVVEIDHTALAIGRMRNRVAITLYAQCRLTGSWPGYATGVSTVSLPPWEEKKYSEGIL